MTMKAKTEGRVELRHLDSRRRCVVEKRRQLNAESCLRKSSRSHRESDTWRGLTPSQGTWVKSRKWSVW